MYITNGLGLGHLSSIFSPRAAQTMPANAKGANRPTIPETGNSIRDTKTM